jgi:hypothetical protein
MAEPEKDHEQPPSSRLRFRFGIGMMLLIMFLASVLAAGAGYAIRSISSIERPGGVSGYLVFMIFTLAGPMLLMVGLSLFRHLMVWIGRQNRR